jgi:hypothetical protein
VSLIILQYVMQSWFVVELQSGMLLPTVAVLYRGEWQYRGHAITGLICIRNLQLWKEIILCRWNAIPGELTTISVIVVGSEVTEYHGVGVCYGSTHR